MPLILGPEDVKTATDMGQMIDVIEAGGFIGTSLQRVFHAGHFFDNQFEALSSSQFTSFEQAKQLVWSDNIKCKGSAATDVGVTFQIVVV